MDDEKKVLKQIYSNKITLGFGPVDFFLEFDLQGKDQKIDPQIEIILSPQRAKSLSIMLNKALEKYEKMIGEINYQPKETETETETETDAE